MCYAHVSIFTETNIFVLSLFLSSSLFKNNRKHSSFSVFALFYENITALSDLSSTSNGGFLLCFATLAVDVEIPVFTVRALGKANKAAKPRFQFELISI